MSRRRSPQGKPSPHVTALNPRVLVRAAFLQGRGFPIEEAAEQLRCCPRRLGTELNRLGLDRLPPAEQAGPGTLDLHLRLTRAERTTLGGAAVDHCMYQPAVGAVLLRAVLAQGRGTVDRLLRDVGAR